MVTLKRKHPCFPNHIRKGSEGPSNYSFHNNSVVLNLSLDNSVVHDFVVRDSVFQNNFLENSRHVQQSISNSKIQRNDSSQ